MNWKSFTYPIRRKYHQIKRIIDFLPIIWNGFDFDYIYSIQLFKKQLERQAKFFESDKSYSDRSKQDASRIRTAIRLLDKVYDEEYSSEWPDKLKEKYGEDVLNWEWEETGPGNETYYHRYKYESWDNADEIKKAKLELISEGEDKQKKAEQLVWKFIGHNIRYWWD